MLYTLYYKINFTRAFYYKYIRLSLSWSILPSFQHLFILQLQQLIWALVAVPALKGEEKNKTLLQGDKPTLRGGVWSSYFPPLCQVRQKKYFHLSRDRQDQRLPELAPPRDPRFPSHPVWARTEKNTEGEDQLATRRPTFGAGSQDILFRGGFVRGKAPAREWRTFTLYNNNNNSSWLGLLKYDWCICISAWFGWMIP